MYSYDKQDSYWGEYDGNFQWHNNMVEQEYNVYNERYQSVYSPPTNEISNIEAMWARFLINQHNEKAKQELDMIQEKLKQDLQIIMQQANQSCEMQCVDGVDGKYGDDLLEYFFGQPDQAEKELCKDNTSLYEECIPKTPEHKPSVDEFEALVDSEIELELSTLVDDPKCEKFVDPFLPTEENSRLNLDVLVKKEQEEWAPLNIIKDFKKVSILLEINVEDPFLVMPPPNKFECFHSFMVKLDSESTHNPLVLQAIMHLKGMGTHLKVHCRLDGRRFKWDLKVD